jgi:hypothetical protein
MSIVFVPVSLLAGTSLRGRFAYCDISQSLKSGPIIDAGSPMPVILMAWPFSSFAAAWNAEAFSLHVTHNPGSPVSNTTSGEFALPDVLLNLPDISTVLPLYFSIVFGSLLYSLYSVSAVVVISAFRGGAGAADVLAGADVFKSPAELFAAPERLVSFDDVEPQAAVIAKTNAMHAVDVRLSFISCSPFFDFCRTVNLCKPDEWKIPMIIVKTRQSPLLCWRSDTFFL